MTDCVQGCPYDGPQLEMWSVGVLLYIIIFGENPFYDPQVAGGGGGREAQIYGIHRPMVGNVRTILPSGHYQGGAAPSPQ